MKSRSTATRTRTSDPIANTRTSRPGPPPCDEIEWLRRAGARGPIRDWSGGNLYTGVLAAPAAAGPDVMSDHKNLRRESTDPRLPGVHPWRPAGGPAEDDVEAFARRGRIA